jgi:hypothetical protein
MHPMENLVLAIGRKNVLATAHVNRELKPWETEGISEVVHDDDAERLGLSGLCQDQA